ncbi:MAG: hypothetical protein M1429_00725 [Patescibacteria group bacterium]|nr:hypothetical protein [Patescibacteria group bacterium]
MKSIYSGPEPSCQLKSKGIMVADQIYRELAVEQRASSLVVPRRTVVAILSDFEREQIIRETFSEEELVRVADQMREMYQPPVGFLKRVSSWWNRVVSFFKVRSLT